MSPYMINIEVGFFVPADYRDALDSSHQTVTLVYD